MGIGRNRADVLILLSLLCFGPLLFVGCAEKETPSAEPTLRSNVESPAMCPWREPEADMERFFPGASDYTRDTLILSSLRLEIQRRVGKPPESNSLYAYRIKRSGNIVGTVLVRRTSGEFGAIEVVIGVSPERKVVGVHFQRLREPPAVMNAIQNPRWLEAFRQKGPSDNFTLGAGIPDVPTEARRSAHAVADAIQSLLIEYDIAETHRLSSKK